MASKMLSTRKQSDALKSYILGSSSPIFHGEAERKGGGAEERQPGRKRDSKSVVDRLPHPPCCEGVAQQDQRRQSSSWQPISIPSPLNPRR